MKIKYDLHCAVVPDFWSRSCYESTHNKIKWDHLFMQYNTIFSIKGTIQNQVIVLVMLQAVPWMRFQRENCHEFLSYFNNIWYICQCLSAVCMENNRLGKSLFFQGLAPTKWPWNLTWWPWKQEFHFLYRKYFFLFICALTASKAWIWIYQPSVNDQLILIVILNQ